MTKSRIHMSVNLSDVVVLCWDTETLNLYCWLRTAWYTCFICPNVSLQEEALSLSPPSRRVSWPFPTQRPVWPNSYHPSFFFNKSDFKCLAFQTGCRSALYSQTGPHRAKPNATPCRAWSHERGPRLVPLESRPTHMRCITSQPENK